MYSGRQASTAAARFWEWRQREYFLSSLAPALTSPQNSECEERLPRCEVEFISQSFIRQDCQQWPDENSTFWQEACLLVFVPGRKSSQGVRARDVTQHPETEAWLIACHPSGLRSLVNRTKEEARPSPYRLQRKGVSVCFMIDHSETERDTTLEVTRKSCIKTER